jgi:methylglyoxal synthase
MEEVKTIALVAHDHRKKDLIEWVKWNYLVLLKHKLVCTGTTGKLVEETVRERLKEEGLPEDQYEMMRLKSGPLGGDQQLGAMISEGKVDFVIFLWDPLQPQAHDVDVKALLRIAVVYNIPIACNRATADFIISSPLMNQPYKRALTDYTEWLDRKLSS